MKFSEIAARVNGFSTPIFGLSWSPPIADVAVARRVIAFVEDRRVLFSTYTNEVPEECVQSVLSIRAFLTETLSAGGIADALADPLRLIRRYCRQFLDRVGATEPERGKDAGGRFLFQDRQWRMHDYWFGEALGEFRQGVGTQIALIAAAYGLDVEDQLAQTLPQPETGTQAAPDAAARRSPPGAP